MAARLINRQFPLADCLAPLFGINGTVDSNDLQFLAVYISVVYPTLEFNRSISDVITHDIPYFATLECFARQYADLLYEFIASVSHRRLVALDRDGYIAMLHDAKTRPGGGSVCEDAVNRFIYEFAQNGLLDFVKFFMMIYTDAIKLRNPYARPAQIAEIATLRGLVHAAIRDDRYNHVAGVVHPDAFGGCVLAAVVRKMDAVDPSWKSMRRMTFADDARRVDGYSIGLPFSIGPANDLNTVMLLVPPEIPSNEYTAEDIARARERAAEFESEIVRLGAAIREMESKLAEAEAQSDELRRAAAHFQSELNKCRAEWHNELRNAGVSDQVISINARLTTEYDQLVARHAQLEKLIADTQREIAGRDAEKAQLQTELRAMQVNFEKAKQEAAIARDSMMRLEADNTEQFAMIQQLRNEQAAAHRAKAPAPKHSGDGSGLESETPTPPTRAPVHHRPSPLQLPRRGASPTIAPIGQFPHAKHDDEAKVPLTWVTPSPSDSPLHHGPDFGRKDSGQAPAQIMKRFDNARGDTPPPQQNITLHNVESHLDPSVAAFAHPPDDDTFMQSLAGVKALSQSGSVSRGLAREPFEMKRTPDTAAQPSAMFPPPRQPGHHASSQRAPMYPPRMEGLPDDEEADPSRALVYSGMDAADNYIDVIRNMNSDIDRGVALIRERVLRADIAAFEEIATHPGGEDVVVQVYNALTENDSPVGYDIANMFMRLVSGVPESEFKGDANGFIAAMNGAARFWNERGINTDDLQSAIDAVRNDIAQSLEEPGTPLMHMPPMDTNPLYGGAINPAHNVQAFVTSCLLNTHVDEMARCIYTWYLQHPNIFKSAREDLWNDGGALFIIDKFKIPVKKHITVAGEIYTIDNNAWKKTRIATVMHNEIVRADKGEQNATQFIDSIASDWFGTLDAFLRHPNNIDLLERHQVDIIVDDTHTSRIQHRLGMRNIAHRNAPRTIGVQSNAAGHPQLRSVGTHQTRFAHAADPYKLRTIGTSLEALKRLHAELVKRGRVGTLQQPANIDAHVRTLEERLKTAIDSTQSGLDWEHIHKLYQDVTMSLHNEGITLDGETRSAITSAIDNLRKSSVASLELLKGLTTVYTAHALVTRINALTAAAPVAPTQHVLGMHQLRRRVGVGIDPHPSHRSNFLVDLDNQFSELEKCLTRAGATATAECDLLADALNRSLNVMYTALPEEP